MMPPLVAMPMVMRMVKIVSDMIVQNILSHNGKTLLAKLPFGSSPYKGLKGLGGRGGWSGADIDGIFLAPSVAVEHGTKPLHLHYAST